MAAFIRFLYTTLFQSDYQITLLIFLSISTTTYVNPYVIHMLYCGILPKPGASARHVKPGSHHNSPQTHD